jgi:hypothetical protein
VKQSPTEFLHIVEGSDWKDAVIALPESRSPYRPWRYGFGAQVGDPVAIVLNTDPPSIMTTIGRVGIDGRIDRAVVEWSDRAPGLIDLATLTAVVDLSHDQDPRQVWQLPGDAAVQMELALDECRYRTDPSMRSGHSSVAAARILLHSQGRCTGCDNAIDLAGEDARDAVYIRTVDAPAREAPEVLIQAASGRASYVDGPYPPKVGCCHSFPLTGPGRCVGGASSACATTDTPACSTIASRSIPSVRAVGRSVLKARCSECRPRMTFRRGATCAGAAGPQTFGPAPRVHTSGSAAISMSTMTGRALLQQPMLRRRLWAGVVGLARSRP